MNRRIIITVSSLLVAGLIGWVAFACAQPNRKEQKAEETPALSSAEPATTETQPGEEVSKAEPEIPIPPPQAGPTATSVMPVLTPVPELAPPKDGPASPSIPMPFPSLTPCSEQHAVETKQPAEECEARQEPSVSLEWVGPKAAKVGQSNSYTLMVRNTCSIPVQQVLVRVRLPQGMSCSECEPKAATETNVLVWELGALPPKQEKALQMKLHAEQKGDVSPQAWVTFTGSSVLHIKVREPKLALKAQGPAKVLVGESATFTLAVTNPGDGSADQVKIHAVLSDGLECPRGSKIDFDIGNLAAGETRNVTVVCAGKIGGSQKIEAAAEADCGLPAQDMAAVSVTMPRLDLQMTGPAMRYLGRGAVYAFKISNPGDAPATNVSLNELVPEGFKVKAASHGGRLDPQVRTVSWFIGELKPSETLKVELEVEPVNTGEFKHKASAVAARGLCAESEWTTRIEGVSALKLEMVDTDDPIEISGETSYEVRIENTGTKVETDIKLLAAIPDKMEFKSVTGPVRFHEEGKTIVFEPIEKLAPEANATFRIHVKAREAGTVNFKIQMTSTNLTDPVIKMEATRIYSDAPETKPH